ncbi:MAG: hypothetical protein BAJALOKI1v1_1180014 [Promethearchaeota archaeon]|nr:MAG: hypothetical protein BAJALOKI1v1_1180014 [Candidatus Lokiarchaeota archaeon]
MIKEEEETLFYTIQAVINGVIEDKKENPKNKKLLEDIEGQINIGLHVEEDFILWINLVMKKGTFITKKGKLEEYDLELIADPEDLMYFLNGTYSTLHMLLKKNRFGNRKLQFNKGTSGSNFGLLLKLPKILVLD